MEPTTEREAIIRMEGDMKSIAKTMEKISESLTRLEDFKLKEIETRITLIERKMYIAIGVIMAFEFIMKFYTAVK
jgi:hypothetical protein